MIAKQSKRCVVSSNKIAVNGSFSKPKRRSKICIKLKKQWLGMVKECMLLGLKYKSLEEEARVEHKTVEREGAMTHGLEETQSSGSETPPTPVQSTRDSEPLISQLPNWLKQMKTG